MKLNTEITLGADAGSVITTEIRKHGEVGVETGGFLLAAAGSDAASIVAFAGASGITRDALFFQISELALDRLFTFADRRRCWVPAQFHSHAGAAFLSLTDQLQGLRVAGFVSAVVPRFADPPAEPASWGWWQFGGDAWVDILPPSAHRDPIEIVTFDEDGVRDG